MFLALEYKSNSKMGFTGRWIENDKQVSMFERRYKSNSMENYKCVSYIQARARVCVCV